MRGYVVCIGDPTKCKYNEISFINPLVPDSTKRSHIPKHAKVCVTFSGHQAVKG